FASYTGIIYVGDCVCNILLLTDTAKTAAAFNSIGHSPALQSHLKDFNIPYVTMDEIWRRLTQGRNTRERELAPGDREGARLYLDFHDCLDQHKYYVFYGVGAVTIPWSYMKKSVGPFVVGAILSLMPDLLYANWRCDDKFKAFQRHCEVVKQGIQERQQQQQQEEELDGGRQAVSGSTGLCWPICPTPAARSGCSLNSSGPNRMQPAPQPPFRGLYYRYHCSTADAAQGHPDNSPPCNGPDLASRLLHLLKHSRNSRMYRSGSALPRLRQHPRLHAAAPRSPPPLSYPAPPPPLHPPPYLPLILTSPIRPPTPDADRPGGPCRLPPSHASPPAGAPPSPPPAAADPPPWSPPPPLPPHLPRGPRPSRASPAPQRCRPRCASRACPAARTTCRTS
ncbi:hypothetical protein Agub_g4475, partial [Astrephomene gubernaculifera]